MKHIADRGYTDVVLNRHVDKEAILEEEYKKDGKKLTEERIKYLVEERKLYKSVEEVKASEEAEEQEEVEDEGEIRNNTTKSKTKNNTKK